MKDILEEANKPDWQRDDSPYRLALAGAMTMAMVMLDKGAEGDEYTKGMLIAQKKVDEQVAKIVSEEVEKYKMRTGEGEGVKDA